MFWTGFRPSFGIFRHFLVLSFLLDSPTTCLSQDTSIPLLILIPSELLIGNILVAFFLRHLQQSFVVSTSRRPTCDVSFHRFIRLLQPVTTELSCPENNFSQHHHKGPSNLDKRFLQSHIMVKSPQPKSVLPVAFSAVDSA